LSYYSLEEEKRIDVKFKTVQFSPGCFSFNIYLKGVEAEVPPLHHTSFTPPVSSHLSHHITTYHVTSLRFASPRLASPNLPTAVLT